MRTTIFFLFFMKTVFSINANQIEERHFLERKNIIPNGPVSLYINEIKDMNILTCGSECIKNAYCLSFVFDSNLKRCRFYSNGKPSLTTSTVHRLFTSRCPISTGFTYEADIDLCYWFPSYKLNWYQANNTCHSNSATLVKIDTFVKRDFFKDLTGPTKNMWVGANDLVNEGTFIWTDGDVLNNGNALWDPNWGQPDNYLNNDHCVQIRSDLGYWLHDTVCNYLSNFACQYDV